MCRPVPGLEHLRVACLAALVAAGCRPDEVSIALMYNAATNVGPTAETRFLQTAVDSVYGTKRPRIRVLALPTERPERRAAQDLSDAVDLIMRFTREPHLVALVGPEASSNALIAAPIMNEARIPQIVPTATSRLLHNAGPYTFMMLPGDSAEGEFIADFVSGPLGARTVSVFYLAEEYGMGLRSSTTRALEARGVRVLDEIPILIDGKCAPETEPNEYDDVVTASFRRVRPDAVVIAARILETGCIAAIVHALAPGVPMVAGDGAILSQRFRERAGAGAGSVYAVSFWDPAAAGSGADGFIRRFREAAGRMPHHGDALAYDATMLIGAAVRAVGKRPRAVRDYIASIGTSRPAWQGVSGDVTFAAGRSHQMLMMRGSPDGPARVVKP